jgi:soluble lytic murein transglycosylase-like protein
MRRLALGAAAVFWPHSGRLPPRDETPQVVLTRQADPTPTVTVLTEYALPPQWAYEDLIQEAAARHHLDPSLVRAVIRVESAFDATAVSSAGAQGLMQLMPELSRELGVDNAFDPRQNIMAGTKYLAQLLAAYDGNVELALASYNAGPGVVERYDGVPPYAETQRYIRAITGLLAQ